MEWEGLWSLKKVLKGASTLTYEKNITRRVGCDWNECRGFNSEGGRVLGGNHPGPSLSSAAGAAGAANIVAAAGRGGRLWACGSGSRLRSRAGLL